MDRDELIAALRQRSAREDTMRLAEAGKEVEVLADKIHIRFRAVVLLAAYGGLCFGELAGLRRSRIDILGGRVVVAETLVENDGRLMFGPPKTKRSRRTVPLPRRVVGELEEHLDRYVSAAADALVFTGPKGAPYVGLVSTGGGGCQRLTPSVLTV